MMAFTNTVTLSFVRICRGKYKLYTESICVDLLRWYLVCCGSHVNLFVNIHTRDDEEDPRSSSPTGHKSAQPEDDCSLIFLKEGNKRNAGDFDAEMF